jgi:ABC-2 type transport system ATP-binding protein
MQYCIETSDLAKSFGEKNAVAGINLHVERGSFYGFLGPNGAGKSTAIKMLTGILAPSRGQARILGYDIVRQPLQVKRRIGVVPEDLCLYDNLTAREYLVFVGRMHKLPPNIVTRRTEELLELMGIADTGKTLCMEFSHGMKKKLAISAALIHDPELLFLDEPFEGIDAIASRTIRQVLNQLRDRGATIFLTSHILEIVERLCTHVGVIHQGCLVREGTKEEVERGGTLEDMFIEVVGRNAESDKSLSWLSGPQP